MRKLLLILTAIILLSCAEPTNDFDYLQWEREIQTEQTESQPINQPTQQQPQTENNNQQEQQEQTQPQPTQPAKEFNYLLTNNHPNLNSYIYMTSPINQGIFENNENERFEFYDGWFFKYWKNKNDFSPTYQGSVKTYQTPYYETETKYFFHGTQNGTLVIFCETTINNNGTGSILIGGKTFSKIIIEEPEIDPFNYLLTPENFSLSDYDLMVSLDTDLEGTWQNKNGETFIFNSSGRSGKYWDGVNNIYQWITLSQLSQPTFNISLNQYRSKDFLTQYIYVRISEDFYLRFFPSVVFKNVDSSINGYGKDLYLNGVQFVKVLFTNRVLVFN